ncbi:tryptophanase leader peptide [Aeromonas media]|uniref:Tryptophanase leader peptide n=2 Tax=Aeromonas TaxID=642 RepID=A0AAW9YI05_9GAMM|nr:tryptophanase leader peptide [Aeromonas rivipollensis]NEX87635.1 tryptophanase leader peptide [Aeromonas rivipollensis]NEY06462.1 tryptophanase leader peptide [Aeromonas rivipollensis]QJT23857.1 tryptophanase leader peptide [Aeromonas media]QYK80664.1 tryptophanase leader peptide [Aeromonas media]
MVVVNFNQMSNNMNIMITSPKWFTLDHKIAFFFPL